MAYLDSIEAFLRKHANLVYAEIVGRPDPVRGGHPRGYPIWLWFVYAASSPRTAAPARPPPSSLTP